MDDVYLDNGLTKEEFVDAFMENPDMQTEFGDCLMEAAEDAWQQYTISIYKDSMSFDSVYNYSTKKLKPTDEVYITKSKDDQNLVFGWANVSILEDGSIPLDWVGDVTAPYVLEQAAYQFVLKYRETGEMHEGESKGQLVESVMFTKEKMAAMGIPEGIVPEAWWVGFYIPDDDVFEKVKSGQYKMFSIQGKARKLQL
jgi:hypothetical protein